MDGVPFLRAVLRRDHLTYERSTDNEFGQEEVMGHESMGQGFNFHFQGFLTFVSKFTAAATSSSSEGFCSLLWDKERLLNFLPMGDTEETPKEELLQGAWSCPFRHNYQLL